MISKNTYRAAYVALFSAAAFFISTSGASAATRTVINNHDSGTGSLRQAISDSSSGDTINFNSSLNGQTITLTSGELLINKNLRIMGPDAKKLTISGNNAVRVFNVTTTGKVSFSGLTIANGFNDTVGGGIYNGGTMTISNSTVSGNGASGSNGAYGGGIYNASTMSIANSTLSGNSAISYFNDPYEPPASGGDIYNGGILTVTNSTVSGGYAYGPFKDTGDGGGISNAGTMSITNQQHA